IKLDANATEYGAGDNCIIINPESEQHFAKLRAYIADSDHDAIIHAASIDNSDMLESALSYGFYSLFLTRSYLLNATQFKKFLVLTNGITQLIETDRINAANATMVGAVRNIKHEFSHIKTGLLDVGEVNEHSTSQIKQVFSEEDSYQVNTLFAIKFGKLWQETYVRINPSEFINQD
ncbi:hypothetical protein DPJ14_25240, partial [Salmonella enterica subsp. enterica serovar Enteritidis]|nr:hypothetical protein [Salmonella enterica subsp. enterica serovar Enteritidis]